MGNRSTITITSRNFPAPITFYGHWSGGQNVEAVRNVLARTGRIGDEGYLTAQVFYEFAKLGNYDGELSFGIFSGEMVEDENPHIQLNADTGEARVKCIGNCGDSVALDIWLEELGYCIECQAKAFDNE